MADSKNKNPKVVKVETDTASATVSTDLASGAPAPVLAVGGDPVSSVAAGDAPLTVVTQPPAVLESVAADPVDAAPVVPEAAAGETLGDMPFSVPLSLVSEVEAREVQPPMWSFYALRCEAAVDVLKERCRQVEGEGYAIESDDGYTDYQLPRAAICYAIKAAGLPSHRATLYWPFPAPAFKPTERRANLVKAAALLLAEIERLDRAESSAD